MIADDAQVWGQESVKCDIYIGKERVYIHSSEYHIDGYSLTADDLEDLLHKLRERNTKPANPLVSASNPIASVINFVENIATQLEAWANETKVPMGWHTGLGLEMINLATAIRTQMARLKAKTD